MLVELAILARYFAAVGDLSQIPSRHSEGSIETAGGRAGLTLRQRAPDRIALEIRLPRGTMRRGFDGEKGWEHSTISRHRPMVLAAQKMFLEQYALVLGSSEHILKKFPKREQLSDLQVRMTEEGGNSETWTFDAVSHLLIRIDAEIDGGPQGMVPVTVLLQDYKKVGDTMLPHTLRTKTKMSESTLHFDTIVHGEPMSDSLFTPPSQP